MFLGTYQLMIDRFRPDLPRNFRKEFLAAYAEERATAEANDLPDCSSMSQGEANADSKRHNASLAA